MNSPWWDEVRASGPPDGVVLAVVRWAMTLIKINAITVPEEAGD